MTREKEEWEKLDLNGVARLAHHFAQIPFLMRGWKIFEPHDHATQADLIAYKESTRSLQRCQVKGTTSSSGSVSLFKGKSNAHPGRPYEASDFDLLIVVVLPVATSNWASDRGIYFVNWNRVHTAISITHHRLREFRVDLWDGWGKREEETKVEKENEQLEMFGSPYDDVDDEHDDDEHDGDRFESREIA